MNSKGYPLAIRVVAGVLAVAATLLTVFYVVGIATRLGIVLGSMQYITAGAALLLPLAFLLVRATPGAQTGKVPWYDLLAAALSFFISLYAFATFVQARQESWGIFPPATALVLGITMCLLVIEAGRRTAGIFFAIAVAVCALSPLYVHLLPGFLRGNDYTIKRLVGALFIDAGGMFGQIMSIFILMFLLFILFGIILQASGAGRFFTNLALSLLGEAKGGAAKVAVFASSLFGTISGSATANVMVSGSFTIPMMKEAGFKPHYAAAVEAAASEGGIIMPPVMGAVAFIMANFLGIPYWRVALAAMVPAILYYWCLFSQVHFYSVNNGIKGIPRSQNQPVGKTLLQGWHIIVTAVILVWMLFIARVAAGQAALWSIVALFVFMTINKATRPNRATFIKVAEDSARIFGQLAPILLAVGLIIGGLRLSGLDLSLMEWMSRASQNVATGLLVLALAGFVLGTGLPGAAVYILLAILLAPGLESMGLNRLAIHMSILYWGILADFTPPTAITPMVAAGFAGASPMKTTLQTMRFGAVLYVAPFFFIFHPVLLLENFQVFPFVLVTLSGLAGFWLLARGFEGYGPPATWTKHLKRIAALVSSVLILTMVWYLQIVGAVLAIGLVLAGRAGRTVNHAVPDQYKPVGESTLNKELQTSPEKHE